MTGARHYFGGLLALFLTATSLAAAGDNSEVDLAYYASSEPSFSGRSEDSTRSGYDAVRWTESIDENGNVIFGGARNGYQEEDQFNVRGIFHLDSDMGKTDVGLSLQYGQLDGTAVDDGDHWASAGHVVHRAGDFTLGAQLSRYEFDIDAENPWGTDELILMGAYDFAWPVAAKAWLPALSLSYKVSTTEVPWLDYVLPYLEWSSIIKDENAFNDSRLYILGAAWARGGGLVYLQ